MATTEQAIPRALRDLPVLETVAPDLRALVLASFVTEHYEFGGVVVREGEPSDAFFVVLAGRARVIATGADGQEVSLDLIGEGEAFGEEGVLDGTARRATVRATEPLSLARLDAGVLRGLVTTHPALGTLLAQQRRARRLERALRLHSAFCHLPRPVIGELLRDCDERTFADGEVVMEQGAPADGLFVVEDGLLRAYRQVEGNAMLLRRLRSGDVVGERGLLLNEPRSATIVADGAATLLFVPAATIERLRARHGRFGDALAERLLLYERRDRAVTGGDVGELPPPVDVADPTGGVDVSETLPAGLEGGGPTRKFPIIRQIDAMDCGAASIAMVCRRFGRPVSLAYIRQAVGTGYDGTSLRGLARGGAMVGLDVKPVKASKDRLDELALPAIVHVDGNHWVIVHEVDGDVVRVADPARGARRLSRQELLERWSGYAALVAPTPALELAPAASTSVRWLWPHIRPWRWKLLIALVMTLLISSTQMLAPVLSQQIVDHVLVERDYTRLHLLVGGMLGIVLATLGLAAVQRILLARSAIGIDASTLDELLDRLLRMPTAYFQTRRASDVETRLDGLRQLREMLVSGGITAVTATTTLLVALVTMSLFSPLLTLCLIASTPLYALLVSVSSRRMRPIFEAMEEASMRFRGRQMDTLKGIETVKVSGVEGATRRRVTSEFQDLREKLYRSDLTQMGYESLSTVAGAIVTLGFVWGAGMLVLGGHLTIGEFVLVNGLVMLAVGPIGTLLGLWDQVQMGSVLLGRLQDVFDNEPEQAEQRERSADLEVFEGHISLRGVSFAYPNEPDRPVLRSIDLEVPPGTSVALVGRSGCGKSTLVKCLAGLNVPTAGTIAYDGVELRDIDVVALRQRLGFVLQQPYIFDDSIPANIAFGEEGFPDAAAVRRAAEIADADGFIARLPMGYETAIGESGLTLSGGQAQRIAIARAVYRRPPVLLLDEATSALDVETERNVKENLDRLLEGRTAFIVAHRLSTIRDCDVIVVIEDGAIAEQGSHEALMRRDGLYAHLYAQQAAI
jgi:ATP-binding cassette subfamily B protein